MKLFSGIRISAALAVATGVLSSSAFALSTAESEALTKSIIDTRAAELPSKAAKLVAKAAKQDRDAVAGAVVSATGLSHPAALISTVTAVVKKSPETAVAVVNAAIDVAPEQASAAVAAVAKVAPSQAEKAVAAASKKAPAQAAVFEREVGASAKKSRTVASASTIFGGSGDINQNTTPIGPIPVNLYAQPGADPERP